MGVAFQSAIQLPIGVGPVDDPASRQAVLKEALVLLGQTAVVMNRNRRGNLGKKREGLQTPERHVQVAMAGDHVERKGSLRIAELPGVPDKVHAVCSTHHGAD
jgi:hypothetical protein